MSLISKLGFCLVYRVATQNQNVPYLVDTPKYQIRNRTKNKCKNVYFYARILHVQNIFNRTFVVDILSIASNNDQCLFCSLFFLSSSSSFRWFVLSAYPPATIFSILCVFRYWCNQKLFVRLFWFSNNNLHRQSIRFLVRYTFPFPFYFYFSFNALFILFIWMREWYTVSLFFCHTHTHSH